MADQLVTDAVNGNPVVVFSKTYCPFCKMAKDALRQAGLKDYVLYELDERGEKEIGQPLASVGGASKILMIVYYQ